MGVLVLSRYSSLLNHDRPTIAWDTYGQVPQKPLRLGSYHFIWPESAMAFQKQAWNGTLTLAERQHDSFSVPPEDVHRYLGQVSMYR
jgi:hypothetical protein